MSIPFSRSKALMTIIAAALAAGNQQLLGVNTAYLSRGKGKGQSGSGCNKHAKSSFKQNKRRGL